ncbi:MAG TPA: hypothetical protein VHV51_16310 [Polyangiaceae bacterium]|jgi:hypothetical protein|nr:hypothetical protein [Polyangiaceae bacterium]
MRAPQILTDFFEWRWAPCVALTAGSLAYVGLAVLFIPNQFESGTSSNSNSASMIGVPPSTAFASSVTQSAFTSAPMRQEPERHFAAPAEPAVEQPIRRGFSPPLERPDMPPPQPVPQPAAPPQPATPPPPPPVEAAPAQPVAAPGVEAPAAPQPPTPTPEQQQQQTE